MNQGNARFRGRIHAQTDVINGVSGMEHLSNSLNARPVGMNASPQIMAQMRGVGYNHHSSQPESVLMEHLKGVNVNGTPTPSNGISSGGAIKSSQSRGNLQSMQPELEYDPWYANQ